MFYVEEGVRSPLYGLGVVVQSGMKPWVRFLGGGLLPVDGHTLQVVPDEVYDAEVRNRFEIERWLTWRITGYANRESAPLPAPRTDLAEKMVRSVEVKLATSRKTPE